MHPTTLFTHQRFFFLKHLDYQSNFCLHFQHFSLSPPFFKWLSTSYTLYTQSRSIAAHIYISCFDRLVIQNIFSVNIIYSTLQILFTSFQFFVQKDFQILFTIHTRSRIERNVFKLFTSQNECQGGKPRESTWNFVGEIFFLIYFFSSSLTIFNCFLVFRLILSVCTRAMKIHFQYFTFQDLNLWIFAIYGAPCLLKFSFFRRSFQFFTSLTVRLTVRTEVRTWKEYFQMQKRENYPEKFPLTMRENERNFPSARVFSHVGKFMKMCFYFFSFWK